MEAEKGAYAERRQFRLAFSCEPFIMTERHRKTGKC